MKFKVTEKMTYLFDGKGSVSWTKSNIIDGLYTVEVIARDEEGERYFKETEDIFAEAPTMEISGCLLNEFRKEVMQTPE